MKLLGKDISAQQLMEKISERLSARGLQASDAGSLGVDGVEPRVDPLTFNLEALGEYADPTRALPLETHRGGAGGRAVVLVKWAFRRSCQILINETLGRQHRFNGHVRDSYAQLSAEMLRLKERLAQLEASSRTAAVSTPKRPARKR